MTELSIRRAIVEWLRREGAYVVVTTGVAAAGTPDLIGSKDGRFFGLEVKQPGRYPTKLQAATLEKIRKTGGVAAVVRSVAEAERTLRGEEEA